MNAITVLAILLILVVVLLGFYEGWTGVRKLVVIVSVVTIVGIGNLLNCWHAFDGDPGTWLTIYGTGLEGGSFALLVFDVLPFLIAYFIGKRFAGKRSDKAGAGTKP